MVLLLNKLLILQSISIILNILSNLDYIKIDNLSKLDFNKKIKLATAIVAINIVYKHFKLN